MLWFKDETAQSEAKIYELIFLKKALGEIFQVHQIKGNKEWLDAELSRVHYVENEINFVTYLDFKILNLQSENTVLFPVLVLKIVEYYLVHISL